MIITRSWLEEFLNLGDITDKTIVESLNNIGLEVSYYHHYSFSENIVLGRIINIIAHPSADNFYICEVDIGEKLLQIISKASNILNINYVVVAKIGAKIGNSIFEETIIHGEISSGIICSNEELGLPKLYEGALILDDSIGELVLGKEINSYKIISDTIIEIDLTPNKGDCLSIYGIARELSAVLNIPIDIKLLYFKTEDNIIGLSRLLKISNNNKSKLSIEYTIANLKLSYLPFLCKLRLAFIKKEKLELVDSVIRYISHTIGVVFKAYDVSLVPKDIDIKILINKENETNEIFLNDKKASTVGFYQDIFLKAKRVSSRVLFEASYIHPKYIKNYMVNHKIKTDDMYYQISRGTNPDISLGIDYLKIFCSKYFQSNFYTGMIKYNNKEPEKILQINALSISRIIGIDISTVEILRILKSLYFVGNSISNNELRIKVPNFRHDIENIQDIAEEILRMRGINSVKSKPLNFVSQDMRNNDNIDIFYQQNELINKIISLGFYENISYIFTNKELQEKYNLPMVSEELDIINPISNNFNTLRTSIILNLLLAVSYNKNHSHSSIKLFEIGIIYNKNREEQKVISFVLSGEEEDSNIFNHGKASDISIDKFMHKILSIIPNVKFKKNKNILNKLIHPFLSADIIIDNVVVGYVSKLAIDVQNDFKIGTTFILEMDYNSIFNKKNIEINISKFPETYKDLSIIIRKDIESIDLIDKIIGFKEDYIKNIYPIDVYSNESLKDKKSLTLRFKIQSFEKTLEDEDISNIINSVIQKLKCIYSIEIKSL